MSFINLNVQDKFSAHLTMCGRVSASVERVIDCSFQSRNNYFLVELENGIISILYVFLVQIDDSGWRMKMVFENEFIPDLNCPERMLRASTNEDIRAVEWRKNMLSVLEIKRLEKLAINYEIRQVKARTDAQDKLSFALEHH